MSKAGDTDINFVFKTGHAVISIKFQKLDTTHNNQHWISLIELAVYSKTQYQSAKPHILCWL